MKIILTFILVLANAPAYAEIFKCEENGLTSYQQLPCKHSGKEFIPAKDISTEEQKAAVEKLNKEIAVQAEQKLQKQEADDKERVIRAQEEQANASYRNANASRAQVIQNADMESRDRLLRERPIYYPGTPIRPVQPIIPLPIPLPVNTPINQQ